MDPIHDKRKPRTWRHLDTMQFSTFLKCQQPHIRCQQHGVQTVSAPWTGKHSRFTLLFESFAVRVLQAAGNVSDATELLKLNWHQINDIKARAVKRGLERRLAEPVPYVGIDEKQFRRGHNYITSLADISARDGCWMSLRSEQKPPQWTCGRPLATPLATVYPVRPLSTTAFMSASISTRRLIRCAEASRRLC